MAEVKPAIESFAKIKVIGVGGSGGSAVNRMIKAKIKGVEFIVANTDVQALHASQASTKIHLGKEITRGLGAGMNPDVGRQAAEESSDEIREALRGADMVFVTCGLGGGTGSGASPVIAEIAKDMGALTVGVVTKPFGFEGVPRRHIAEEAFDALQEQVDTIISIPNDRVLQITDKKTSMLDAFNIVDDVLKQGVQGISEVITVPMIVNVDFADVRAIMNETGSALMGIGRASGENAVVEAAKKAISSPLLEMDVEGAKGILYTIMGGPNLSMHEFDEASQIITSRSDSDARVIFGAGIDDTLGDEVKVCVIATGFDGTVTKREAPERKPESYYANKRIPSPAPVNEAPPKRTVAPAPAPEPRPAPAPKPFAAVKRIVERVVPEPEEEIEEEPIAAFEPEEENPFVKRVIPAARELQTAAAAPAPSAEEDLEIPAFIRRNMK